MSDTSSSRTARFAPSVMSAVIAWAIYEVVFYGLAALPGIPYVDWFATAGNGLRTAVIPLLAGSVFLLLFVFVSRWDHLWRDPVRLDTTVMMKVSLVVWVLMIVMRVVGTDWSAIPMPLLGAMIAAGVGVGFAEEMMFRGIFLRGMRAGRRSERSAAIWTAAAFGLLHLPNVFLGLGLIGLSQVVLAAFSGLLLYVWRRQWGLIWPAMVAHGVWDISTFATGQAGRPWAVAASLPSSGVMLVLGVIVLIDIVRKDGTTVAISD